MSHIVQTDNRWVLDGEVIINTASALLTASKGLTLGSETIIDFAKVTDIDTSTISLILEWKRRAFAEIKLIKLINLPTNLNSLTKLYGVDELIK